jgi:hypothetical protein
MSCTPCETLAHAKFSMDNPPPWPFQNMMVYRLMEWATTGSGQKSQIEVNHLANNVIGATDFNPADLSNFSAQCQYKQFDLSEEQSQWCSGNGWHESLIHIPILTGHKDPAGSGCHFTIHNLHH